MVRTQRGTAVRRWPVVAAAAFLGLTTLAVPAAATVRSGSASVTVLTNLCYEPTHGGCNDGTYHEFDEYLPAVPGKAPAVILIHPGSHRAGDKADVANIAGALANDGFVAFSVNYRLDTPTAPGYPMEAQDIEAATAYLRSHAGHYGALADRFALLGFSAGADLALRAGLEAQQDDPAAQAQVLAGWSGGYDYTGQGGPPLNPGQLANVAQYLGCDPTVPTCQPTAAVASATTWVAPGDPPVLLANSTDWKVGCEVTDPQQASYLAQLLQEAGDTVQLDFNSECAHANAYADVELGPTTVFLEDHLFTVPVVTSSPTVTFHVGRAGSKTVKTTAIPVAQLTETGALPAGVTFTGEAKGKGVISGTPAAGTQGTYPITVKAANGLEGDGTQSLVVTVR